MEPVLEQTHLKKILISRFLSFLNQRQKSSKIIPKQYDVNSVTGRNIKRIFYSITDLPKLMLTILSMLRFLMEIIGEFISYMNLLMWSLASLWLMDFRLMNAMRCLKLPALPIGWKVLHNVSLVAGWKFRKWDALHSGWKGLHAVSLVAF